MIMDEIEFFNVSEIVSDGKILRFPESLIQTLGCEQHQRGRFYGYRSIGVELRFVMESKFFDLKLRADKEETKVYVFFGDYMHQVYTLKEGIVTNLHVEVPEKFYLYQSKLPRQAFDPNVIRIVIGYSGYVSYCGLNTYGKRRPPHSTEVPQKKILIYGSSISHGSESLEYINSYAFLLSRMLNVDVMNKSIPGSCQAEESICHFLKEIPCDVVFIEFGVNVIQLFSAEEYQSRFQKLLNSLQAKEIFYTSVLDNGGLFDEFTRSKILQFRTFANQQKRGRYIEPQDLLPTLSYLTTDLLHPSDFGQTWIAIALSTIITKGKA